MSDEQGANRTAANLRQLLQAQFRQLAQFFLDLNEIDDLIHFCTPSKLIDSKTARNALFLRDEGFRQHVRSIIGRQ
jgi:hypothetical protein